MGTSVADGVMKWRPHRLTSHSIVVDVLSVVEDAIDETVERRSEDILTNPNNCE